jgi:hypothetical protein
MTMYFFYPIQQCAHHVYHTAILLSPASSLLHDNKQWTAHDEVLITDYLNGPSDWGLLLTTISVGTRRPTSVTTFAEKIAVACENIVNIYGAVTFALEQSSHSPQSVTKLQGSGDGSTLYYAHPHSVTSWDIQTGGLIDTFHTQSEIKDMEISQTDGHIACHLSDSTVAFWNSHTRKEGSFGNSEPVVTIRWLSSAELVVATKSSVYVANIATRSISNSYITNGVWGVVVPSSDVVMVGVSEVDRWNPRVLCSLRPITYKSGLLSEDEKPSHNFGDPNLGCRGQLICPTSVGNQIVAITPPNGVRVISVEQDRWINPPPLKKAESVAASLVRNLVVKTEDSVQVFSIEALASDTQENMISPPSHIYPLGEAHAICLRTNRRLTIIELEALGKLHPDINSLSLDSLTNSLASARLSCGRGLVAEFGVRMVMEVWKSHASLPRWKETVEERALLGESSPARTWVATLYDSPQRELLVKDATDGVIVAKLPLEDAGSEGTWVAYDLAFTSETRFYLEVDGPGYHAKIPFDLIISPSGQYPYTIKQGNPVPLSKPPTTPPPPYTLDASCQWVLDRQSRKICWIPPENTRRGNGGHFWVGTSLIMLGSDGVVRKLSFKEPDC